jgi:hydroxyacylglutathione hydrolase
MIHVLHACAFEDNYVWLVGDGSGRVAVVDPGDADPVLAVLEAGHLTPVAVLCTHHHHDHVDGIADLLRRYPMPVYGPARERIPNRTHALQDGDRVRLPGTTIELDVLDTPGHTAGHIAFVAPGAVFCGDTLFSAGCGRLFEGTAAQLHASLERLAALPENTAVYCAHEYTLDGLRFAAAVEPTNTDVTAHRAWAAERRAAGQSTLPSTIGLERRINPFLRCSQPAVQRAVATHCGRELSGIVNVFAELRRWKDGFRG